LPRQFENPPGQRPVGAGDPFTGSSAPLTPPPSGDDTVSSFELQPATASSHALATRLMVFFIFAPALASADDMPPQLSAASSRATAAARRESGSPNVAMDVATAARDAG
jgi:hypothetical protein